ncbi:peptidase domain-containing ABC transporter [Pedobacter gandavensis]|uniref:peptidase domain-containing ABC transporter n=1 Tax=Pedobacter gandavensis TaxID=2679963 RepID=UPI002931D7D5|nr:peptidase domain-containing ABC transporter [Pedobacter gandavensis]
MFKKFPHYRQYDEMDCGPTCIKIISKYYKKDLSLDHIRELSRTTRQGSSLLGLSEAAEKVGFISCGQKMPYEDLLESSSLPVVAYWNQKHFVVVYKVKKDMVYVSDPAHGLLKYSKEEFLKGWADDQGSGIILCLLPGEEFFKLKSTGGKGVRTDFGIIYKYLFRYKKLLIQLLIGLFVGSLLQLLVPFITQYMVDYGIKNKDINFIYLMLLSQLLLFAGRMSVEILRSYILVHLSSRVNINLLSDFFIKLMKLPLSFFDTKMVGDIMQRIQDHSRIESFLTSGTINILFSTINLVIFSAILCFYSPAIFTVFLIGSVIYFIWIFLFMKKNAELDYKRFDQLSINHEKNLELIYGMQEIKLHNAETKKRWQWEELQAKLFKLNLKNLSLKQAQTGGASLINELKNILITFLAAKLVIDGNVTIGMMLSISYITGQLNSPITQLVEFIQLFQNARLSMARINEIHNREDEEIEAPIAENRSGSIEISNLYFKYPEVPNGSYTLKDINLSIPENKITAIVGSSGSGKTTLLKVLLRFYKIERGDISIADQSIYDISHHNWRNKCGVVMQEGYIFNDTIARNIAVGDDEVDMDKLENAVTIANMGQFVNDLPLGMNTKIGQTGVGLSTGQKQRILIARAVYKDPDFIIFDEATSALDATNEKIIVENLNRFFKGKTVIIIAHRLSTVRNADKIIVLEQGQVIEQGCHNELVTARNYYYNLVKNQLEIAS